MMKNLSLNLVLFKDLILKGIKSEYFQKLKIKHWVKKKLINYLKSIEKEVNLISKIKSHWINKKLINYLKSIGKRLNLVEKLICLIRRIKRVEDIRPIP